MVRTDFFKGFIGSPIPWLRIDFWDGLRIWLGLTFLMVHWLIFVSIWVGSPDLEWFLGWFKGLVKIDISDGSFVDFYKYLG
jgi:hypothetical protein